MEARINQVVGRRTTKLSLLDFDVYTIAHKLVMDVFQVTDRFPQEVKYDLVEKVRTSSSKLAVKAAEAWSEKKFSPKNIRDMNKNVSEIKQWLMFALNCGYVDAGTYRRINKQYDKLMLKLAVLY